MASRKGAALASDSALNEGQKDNTPGKRPSILNHKHQSTAPKWWCDTLKVHPAAELFPLLGEAELRALADDIKKHGLRNSVVIHQDQSGEPVLLDGRNRLDALALLGEDITLDNSVIFERRPADNDPIAYIISANIHRRHLTAEQRRKLIAKLLEAMPDKSNRQIAETVKADHKTVGRVRAEKERRGEIPHVSTRADTKGHRQPAAKKKRRTEDDFARPMAAKRVAKAAAVAPIRDPVAPDEQLALLREFARFIIGRAKSVSTDPKDHAEWKFLRGQVKAVLS